MPRFLVTLFFAACAAPAWAATACTQHFALGIAPVITNPQLQPRTREVCFEAFAVLHSGLSRTPLYAAEHLTRSNLLEARTLSRKDAFHPEPSLPAVDRSELGDYTRSGYDRGHMAPNGDMPTRTAQAQSFSLANMVPQVHANNAGVCAGIEMAVRELALTEGELYVVSGPAFLGADAQQIGRGVLVPTHLWKVVYSPAQQRAGAYVITNDESRAYSAITLRDLEQMVGVRALPALAPRLQEAGMTLPRPLAQGGGGSRRRAGRDEGSGQAKAPEPVQGGFTLQDLARSVEKALRHALNWISLPSSVFPFFILHPIASIAPTMTTHASNATAFEPYANEHDVLRIGHLEIENRVDRVSLTGNVVLTKDQAGLALARELQALLAAVIQVLEADKTLPEAVEILAPKTVKNPFA